MYLIVGLGNPEPEYSFTRHNMGFDVINKLSEKFNIGLNKRKFNALYGTGNIENETVILCKPQTYMNLSGISVIEFIKFYNISLENVLIIYDDIDIETGTIRIRKNGSSAGHNGIKSLIDNLQTEEFHRVRIGTGPCEDREDLINFVIKKVSDEEYARLQDGIILGTEAVENILKYGIDNAMNQRGKNKC